MDSKAELRDSLRKLLACLHDDAASSPIATDEELLLAPTEKKAETTLKVTIKLVNCFLLAYQSTPALELNLRVQLFFSFQRHP